MYFCQIVWGNIKIVLDKFVACFRVSWQPGGGGGNEREKKIRERERETNRKK